MENPENLVGKSNFTVYPIWKIPENRGQWLKQCTITDLFLTFAVDLAHFVHYPSSVRTN